MMPADPTGRLGQIDTFAPRNRILFGGLEYIADTRGDLVFAEFTAPSRTLIGLAMPALESPSDPIYRLALALRTASSREGSASSGGQIPASARPIVSAEGLSSAFEAESGGGG